MTIEEISQKAAKALNQGDWEEYQQYWHAIPMYQKTEFLVAVVNWGQRSGNFEHN